MHVVSTILKSSDYDYIVKEWKQISFHDDNAMYRFITGPVHQKPIRRAISTDSSYS